MNITETSHLKLIDQTKLRPDVNPCPNVVCLSNPSLSSPAQFALQSYVAHPSARMEHKLDEIVEPSYAGFIFDDEHLRFGGCCTTLLGIGCMAKIGCMLLHVLYLSLIHI